jgi:hypothetical protein
MHLAHQVSLCSGKNKRYCSGGAINKLLEDENRRLMITRATKPCTWVTGGWWALQLAKAWPRVHLVSLRGYPPHFF